MKLMICALNTNVADYIVDIPRELLYLTSVSNFLLAYTSRTRMPMVMSVFILVDM